MCMRAHVRVQVGSKHWIVARHVLIPCALTLLSCSPWHLTLFALFYSPPLISQPLFWLLVVGCTLKALEMRWEMGEGFKGKLH